MTSQRPAHHVAELAGSLWTFVRGDLASISSLNAPGQWSTWQTSDPSLDRRSHALKTSPAERRSLRRRRAVSL